VESISETLVEKVKVESKGEGTWRRYAIFGR